jgi:hypothetical protein
MATRGVVMDIDREEAQLSPELIHEQELAQAMGAMLGLAAVLAAGVAAALTLGLPGVWRFIPIA